MGLVFTSQNIVWCHVFGAQYEKKNVPRRPLATAESIVLKVNVLRAKLLKLSIFDTHIIKWMKNFKLEHSCTKINHALLAIGLSMKFMWNIALLARYMSSSLNDVDDDDKNVNFFVPLSFDQMCWIFALNSIYKYIYHLVEIKKNFDLNIYIN